MPSYCRREKHYTEDVFGSEEYTRTKNKKWILRSTCLICGACKVNFIKLYPIRVDKNKHQKYFEYISTVYWSTTGNMDDFIPELTQNVVFADSLHKDNVTK